MSASRDTIGLEDVKRRATEEEDPKIRASLLLDECDRIVIEHPKAGIELATMALASSKAAGCRRSIARSLSQRGIGRSLAGDQDGARKDTLKALNLYRKLSDDHGVAQTLRTLGASYNKCGRYREALEMFTPALELATRIGDMPRVARILKGMGIAQMQLGNLTTAQELLLRGIRICQDNGDGETEGTFYSMLAQIYETHDDDDRALECLYKALEYAGGTGNAEEGMLLANLGQRLYLRGELNDAERHLVRSLEIHCKRSYPLGICVSLSFLSCFYRTAGDLTTATEYSTRARAIAQEIDNPRLHAEIAINDGRLYRALGEIDRAIDLFHESLHHLAIAGQRPLEFEAYRILSDLYEEKGELGSAFFYHKKYVTLKEEIAGEKTLRRIAELHLQFEAEQAKWEQKIMQLRNAQLESEIEHKTRELSTLSLAQNRRAQILHELQRRIQSGLQTPGSERLALYDLGRRIEAEQKEPQSYRELTNEASRNHQEFTRSLAQQFPALTSAELQVCSLLRANLSTKEIADLLKVTTRNVEAHRYHIRKKMQLPTGTNLATFLAGLQA